MQQLSRPCRGIVWRSIALFLGLFALAALETASAAPVGATCAGFQRLELKTAKGLCAGLVASHLGFARGIAVSGNEVWIADMGGWRKGHGRLLRIKDGGRGKVEEMLNHLDEPNALLTLPNGKLLVGSLGRIDMFDPQGAEPGKLQLEPLLTGLPTTGRHPLPALAAAADGTLYVNVGSATDHCEGAENAAPDPKAACPETQETPPRAAIIATRWDVTTVESAANAKVVARGLRNSMALALDASSRLWAAVNARDFINLADPSLSDETLPPDTLVRVASGADYGWPQCYGAGQTSPEYGSLGCKSKTAPTLLLPAHAAPLGMVYIDAAKPLGVLKSGLLIGYHGYRKTGHRIVWLPFAGEGEIKGEPVDIAFGWEGQSADGDKKGAKEAFSDSGVPLNPGSPVALARLPNGNVLVSDDHNGILIVIGVDK